MSFVLLRDEINAKKSLELAISNLSKDGRSWCTQMAGRLRGLRERVELEFDSLPSELLKWRDEHLVKLGLLEFKGTDTDEERGNA